MGTVLIDHRIVIAVSYDQRVLTGDARIVEQHILTWQSANRGRVAIKIDAVVSLRVGVAKCDDTHRRNPILLTIYSRPPGFASSRQRSLLPPCPIRAAANCGVLIRNHVIEPSSRVFAIDSAYPIADPSAASNSTPASLRRAPPTGLSSCNNGS